MKKLKIWAAYFASLFKKRAPAPGKPVSEGRLDAVAICEAIWVQKQLDDLLLMNEQITKQLHQKPFHGPYLEKRDKIHHDIEKLQPILLNAGIAVSNHIEQKYGVLFCLLSGRNRPVEKKPEESKKSMIVTP